MAKSIIASALMVFVMAGSAMALDAEKGGWLEDFDKAKKEAAANEKLILAYFWFKGCGGCRTVEKTVLNDGKFVEFSKKVVLLSVNIREKWGGALRTSISIGSFPHAAMFDGKGDLVAKFQMQLFDVDETIKFVGDCLEYPKLKKEEAEKQGDFEWSLKYGRVLSICGKYEEADACYRRAEKLSKDRDAKTKAELSYAQASHTIRKGEYEEAEKYIGKVEEFDKDGAAGFLKDAKKLYLDIADALRKERKPDDAKKYADKAIEADKDGKFGFLNDAKLLKAQLLSMARDSDGALKILLALEKEVKDKELLVKVLNFSGSIYMQKKEYDNSIARFEAILKAADDDKEKARALYRIGYIHLEKKEYEKAIARYEEMHNISEDKQFKAAALYFIADVYVRMEKYDMAIAKFNKMITKYPDDPRVRYARAQIEQVGKLKANAAEEKEEEVKEEVKEEEKEEAIEKKTEKTKEKEKEKEEEGKEEKKEEENKKE
jgi:tetratricopeptide (TPR) repeat protein